jgi:signal transduction histidine kinase
VREAGTALFMSDVRHTERATRAGARASRRVPMPWIIAGAVILIVFVIAFALAAAL